MAHLRNVEPLYKAHHIKTHNATHNYTQMYDAKRNKQRKLITDGTPPFANLPSGEWYYNDVYKYINISIEMTK